MRNVHGSYIVHACIPKIIVLISLSCTYPQFPTFVVKVKKRRTWLDWSLTKKSSRNKEKKIYLLYSRPELGTISYLKTTARCFRCSPNNLFWQRSCAIQLQVLFNKIEVKNVWKLRYYWLYSLPNREFSCHYIRKFFSSLILIIVICAPMHLLSVISSLLLVSVLQTLKSVCYKSFAVYMYMKLRYDSSLVYWFTHILWKT